MKKILIITLLLNLSACAPSFIRTYEGPEMNMDDIAIIRGIDGSYDARLHNYAKVEPNQTKKDLHYKNLNLFMRGRPGEIHSKPGTYIVTAHCQSGNRYAYPKTSVKAEAGMTYELQCQAVPEKPGRVRLVVLNSLKTLSSK